MVANPSRWTHLGCSHVVSRLLRGCSPPHGRLSQQDRDPLHDDVLAEALADRKDLTGPAPLTPMSAAERVWPQMRTQQSLDGDRLRRCQ